MLKALNGTFLTDSDIRNVPSQQYFLTVDPRTVADGWLNLFPVLQFSLPLQPFLIRGLVPLFNFAPLTLLPRLRISGIKYMNKEIRREKLFSLCTVPLTTGAMSLNLFYILASSYFDNVNITG
jgi:hypothetical protein